MGLAALLACADGRATSGGAVKQKLAPHPGRAAESRAGLALLSANADGCATCGDVG